MREREILAGLISSLFANLLDLDPNVKEYYLKADADMATISIGAAVAVLPPMALLDYLHYQFSGDFFVAVSFEGLFAVFSIVMITLIRRTGRVKTYEALAFTWTMVTSIFGFLTLLLQPDRVIENILFCLLFLIANFITIPNKILFRMVPAAIIILAIVTTMLTNHTWFGFLDKYMFALTLIMLTGAGLVVVARNNYFKQTAFLLQKGEREARILYEELALTDPLTEIPNRRNFFVHAEEEWKRYKWYGTHFCIAIIDLDRFKLINDTHGHAAGDEVLRHFSTQVAIHTRSTDYFARFGGEEFAFIIRETNQNDAVKALSRLKENVQADKALPSGEEVKITFSAGVAQAGTEDKSLDDLIRRADQAMYQAKELGRDRIEQG